MLLRSSSAPLVQSPFSDYPDNNNNNNNNRRTNIAHGLQHLSSFSCNLSDRAVGWKTFRRALSDSNLEGLTFSSSIGLEEVYSSMSESMHQHETSMLHTEPSFSMYSSIDKLEAEPENDKLLERSATIGESIESQFSFGKNAMRIIKEDFTKEEEEDEDEHRASEYDCNFDIEKHYDKMIREDPSDPLVLRNYAQYLESKKDFSGAEEYYFRATVADPNDGEILSRYAELVWELHGHKSRASNYFERAIRAAPEDSNILAAYASFLWKTDESDEEECLFNMTQVDESSTDFIEEKRPSSPPLHLAMGLGLGIDITDFGGDYMIPQSDKCSGVEEYYKMMVEADLHNPLFLRNYAQYLHQSKGDLRRAEEYYSRAILEDPSDGYVLSLYADIVWELHRDKDTAVSYFQRAVAATPEDSNVLAAYAKFLWETEVEEDAIEVAQIPISAAAATTKNVITC